MKCMIETCQEESVIHILGIQNRRLLPQRDVCELHAGAQLPFCESGGKTSLGTGLQGGLSRYEPHFIVFFDKCEGDGLYLWEVGGSKRFSIPIARYEAWSILRALQGTELSRPFTFAAFSLIMKSLGGKLEEVAVAELDQKGQCYHAKVKLRQDDRLVVVDTRPSDAFALAIACGAPILVADSVLSRTADLGWT